MVQLVLVHMYLVECMLLVVFVLLADYMSVQLILFSDAQDQNVRCWALKCGPGALFSPAKMVGGKFPLGTYYGLEHLFLFDIEQVERILNRHK